MALILNLHVVIDVASISFTLSMAIAFSYAIKFTIRKCRKRTKDKTAKRRKSTKDKHIVTR